MREIPQVVEMKFLGPFEVSIEFSDGWSGVWRPKPHEVFIGEMGEPLHDLEYFRRGFIEMGAPTWPNGWDASPEALYAILKAAGDLHRPSDAAA